MGVSGDWWTRGLYGVRALAAGDSCSHQRPSRQGRLWAQSELRAEDRKQGHKEYPSHFRRSHDCQALWPLGPGSHPARFFPCAPSAYCLSHRAVSEAGEGVFSEPPHLQLQISPCPEEDRGRVFPGSPGTQPPELTCSLKALDSVTASETLRNNWPRKRSRDKTSLFCVVPPPPPPHPPRKYKGNQGEFLPMISKAKVTVTGWLLPEGSGFWSLWIFFLNSWTKRGWWCLAKFLPAPASCFDELIAVWSFVRFVGVSRAAMKVGSKWSMSYLKQHSSENKLSCKILRKGWVTSFRGRKVLGSSLPFARTRQPGMSVGQWMLMSFLPAMGKWDSQKGCISFLPLFTVLDSSALETGTTGTGLTGWKGWLGSMWRWKKRCRPGVNCCPQERKKASCQ